ncbi:MAG TPA: glycosyltransferase family 2 protein [Ilumatobacter sp.]|nr:glycosyltransferase family 2 protein [Ilumatobacter sp.]
MLPLFEYKLEATRWRAARRLTATEDAIVAAFRAQLGRLAPAEVATVIPTYRRPVQLGSAVESALTQTFEDQRVIVVDDGAGLDGALPDDPRLTVVQLPHNIGTAGVVRNIGIRLTDSRLVAFLDDDNTWEPRHLELAIEAHARGAELTYSRLQRVDESGELIDVLGEPFERRQMRERSLVDTNVIVVRRSEGLQFSRVPRRRGDFPLEDWELVWRLSRHMQVTYIPEVTVRYVRHRGSNYSDWGAASDSSEHRA